ncbi:hypothetical protein L7F22_002196 [Adiantum nelumboides]|nr:hypothetical protein [Adiantum nelumboides]
MKRFFPTVQRDASFKKMAMSQEGEIMASSPSATAENDSILVNCCTSPEAAPATATAAAASNTCLEKELQEEGPLRFMSWNANSFFLRIKNNLEELTSFIQRFDPDVIAIQEVRIPAAGRKGEPKNQGEMKDDTNSARDEKQIMIRALSRPPFGSYKTWWSLADTKYGGTALLVKHCFKPLNVKFSLDEIDMQKHEADGRVIIAEFEQFLLMNTYAPNNGWKEEELSFQRRRKWDKKILDFVLRISNKPLIWCGDLNVSHEEIDVSHAEFFKNARLQGYVPPRKEDCGQPGFTDAERERFSKMLKEGGLIDTYRWLQQQKDMDGGFTWSGNPVGKYRGKRMRIDYFLISRMLLPRLMKSTIHGRGIEMEGFYGSDHCPITLELSCKLSP